MISDTVKNYLICFLVFYLILDWGAAMVIYGRQPHLMANMIKNLKNTKFLAVIAVAVLACVLLHRCLSTDETVHPSNLPHEEEMAPLMENPEHYYNYDGHGDATVNDDDDNTAPMDDMGDMGDMGDEPQGMENTMPDNAANTTEDFTPGPDTLDNYAPF